MEFGFSTPKKWRVTSWLLRKWMGTPYSHVYMKFYNGFTGEFVVYEASYGDVHRQAYKNFEESNKIINEISFDLEREDMKRAVAFLDDQLQKPYGYAALFGIILNQLFGISFGHDGDKKFICSELVARAFPEVFNTDGKVDYATPRDIYEILEEL